MSGSPDFYLTPHTCSVIMAKMEKIEKKPLGVVDALSAGFELIARHPWVLLIPIMLDLFLWLGPQISAKPFIEQGVSAISAYLPADPSAETTQNTEALRKVLNTANIFGVMAVGVPSLFGVIPPTDGSTTLPIFNVDEGSTLVTLLIGLGLLGILITSVYFGLIARATRSEIDPTDSFLLRLLKAFLDTILLSVAAITFILMLGMGAFLVSLFSPGLGSFISLAETMLIFWAMLYLTFVLPAIFVSGANAPQAVVNSISVFRFDFWSAIGLIILTYVIRMGFVFVWQFFLDSTFGVIFAIMASAFLGSGLIAANMVFYNDRMNWMITVREHIRRQQTQIKG